MWDWKCFFKGDHCFFHPHLQPLLWLVHVCTDTLTHSLAHAHVHTQEFWHTPVHSSTWQFKRRVYAFRTCVCRRPLQSPGGVCNPSLNFYSISVKDRAFTCVFTVSVSSFVHENVEFKGFAVSFPFCFRGAIFLPPCETENIPLLKLTLPPH